MDFAPSITWKNDKNAQRGVIFSLFFRFTARSFPTRFWHRFWIDFSSILAPNSVSNRSCKLIKKWFFFVSILHRFLIDFDGKWEPRWHPKSIKNQCKIDTFSTPAFSGRLKAPPVPIFLDFGTPGLRFSRFFYHFWTKLIHQYIDTPIHLYRYIDTPMHRYIDTSTHRYIDTAKHRYTDTWIHGYTDTSIHRYTHTSIPIHPYKAYHTPTHRYIDTSIHRYTDTSINRYTDPPIHRYTDTPIHRYTDTPMNQLRSCN